MTRDEKLQAIKEMDVDIIMDCPHHYLIHDGADDEECISNCGVDTCRDCWIKALEVIDNANL